MTSGLRRPRARRRSLRGRAARGSALRRSASRSGCFFKRCLVIRTVTKPAAAVSASRSRSLLEGEAAGVEVPAIELDDQLLAQGRGVDLVAADDGVHLGLRQSVALAEGGEVILELRAAGALGGDADAVLELGAAWMPGVAPTTSVRWLIRARYPLCLPLLMARLSDFGAHPWRHVEKRAGERGGRYAEMAGDCRFGGGVCDGP